MAIELNWNPPGMIVNIADDYDFTAKFELRDEAGNLVNWPEGTEASLILSDSGSAFTATWPATVDGAVLRFYAPKAQSNLVPDGCGAEVSLQYGASGVPVKWLAGGVRRSVRHDYPG